MCVNSPFLKQMRLYGKNVYRHNGDDDEDEEDGEDDDDEN